jgi:hypothetical protein
MNSRYSSAPAQEQGLWSGSSLWRWSVAFTGLSAAIFTYAVGSRQPDKQPKINDSASFNSPASRTRVQPPSPPLPMHSPTASTMLQDAIVPTEVANTFRDVPTPVSATQNGSSVRWLNNTREGTISGAGLIAAYCCAGASSTIYADTTVSRGKHYMELTISVRPGATQPDTWTQAGVTSEMAAAHRMPSYMHRNPGNDVYGILQRGQTKGLSHGDTVMIALDMDGGQFYWGVNGAWQNGDPNNGKGDPLAPGKSYRPFVAISASSSKSTPEGDRWIANFGSQTFKYGLPAGFSSYGSSQAQTVARVVEPGKTAAAQTPFVNQFFSNQVTLLGKSIPLPDGTWRAISYMQAAPGQDESLLLGKIQNQKLVELTAVRVQLSKDGRGFAPQNSCVRQDLFGKYVLDNEPNGLQDCWWVNHAAQIWAQPVFNAASSNLAALSVPVPDSLINVGFHKATLNDSMTVFIISIPKSAALSHQSPIGSLASGIRVGSPSLRRSWSI